MKKFKKPGIVFLCVLLVMGVSYMCYRIDSLIVRNDSLSKDHADVMTMYNAVNSVNKELVIKEEKRDKVLAEADAEIERLSNITSSPVIKIIYKSKMVEVVKETDHREEISKYKEKDKNKSDKIIILEASRNDLSKALGVNKLVLEDSIELNRKYKKRGVIQKVLIVGAFFGGVYTGYKIWRNK